MNSYQCQPLSGPIDATVTLPGSKSITNRALVVAALADGHSLLTGLLLAEDTRLMIELLRSLGIAITVDETDCVAEVTGCRGHLPANSEKLFCGNAGTVMRFGTALVALGYGRFELDGVERMRQRPIEGLGRSMQSLGVGIEYLQREGYPPLAVHAKGLKGGDVAFHSPVSSQFVSALLLVAPYAAGDVLIEVTGQVPSSPYLKMTTAIMEQFGAAVIEQYDNEGGPRFGKDDGGSTGSSALQPAPCRGAVSPIRSTVANGTDDTCPGARAPVTRAVRFIVAAPQRYRGRRYDIEPDASNSSYFLAAPAIAGGRVTVDGLGGDSIQGDALFVDVLERMGCRIDREPKRFTVHGPPLAGGLCPQGKPLQGIDIDLNEMPDTVQTLAVLALFANGPTVIRNVGHLRIKETDRLDALTRELTKLGARIEPLRDGLTIHPPDRITPATIETYSDHRMAMSFALVGLVQPGIVIKEPRCCEKSFPHFFDSFERMIRRLKSHKKR